MLWKRLTGWSFTVTTEKLRFQPENCGYNLLRSSVTSKSLPTFVPEQLRRIRHCRFRIGALKCGKRLIDQVLRINWENRNYILTPHNGEEISVMWGVNAKCRRIAGTGQRCTESEIFDSDSAPASAEYTPTPFWHILKFWTPTPAQTLKSV